MRQTYGDDKRGAGVRFEQELAAFLYRSGWTQEHLAAREGKSRVWVNYQVRFGRFLTECENVTTVTNLTGRRFRDYWNRTDKGETNERIRFRAVVAMIESEADAAGEASPPRKEIGGAIREHFADGRWRKFETIADRIDAPEHDVRRTLDAMQRGAYGAKAERKQVGRGHEYRIFPQDRTISSAELKHRRMDAITAPSG